MVTILWTLSNGFCQRIHSSFEMPKEEWESMPEAERELTVSDEVLQHANYGWRYNFDGTEVIFWNSIDIVGCFNEYYEPATAYMGLTDGEMNEEARESAFNDIEWSYSVDENAIV